MSAITSGNILPDGSDLYSNELLRRPSLTVCIRFYTDFFALPGTPRGIDGVPIRESNTPLERIDPWLSSRY